MNKEKVGAKLKSYYYVAKARATCSLQPAIIVETLGVVGLRVYGFALCVGLRLGFHFKVRPYVMPLFHLYHINGKALTLPNAPY